MSAQNMSGSRATVRSIKCHYCDKSFALGENHRCAAVSLSDFPNLEMSIRAFPNMGGNGTDFVVGMNRKMVEEMGIEWGTETARAAVGLINGQETVVTLITPNDYEAGEPANAPKYRDEPAGSFSRLRWVAKVRP